MMESSIQGLLDSLQPRLRATLICLSHSWGGLEQVTAHDVSELVALGLDVSLLCLSESPIHQFFSTSSGSSVRCIPLDYRPRDYFDPRLRHWLQREIKQQGLNLVHTHQTSLLGSISPWLWRTPQVALFASRHIMNSHDKRNFFHRLIYSRLDALIVMSQTLRENVLATHPLRERQVKVVHLGLDFERFDPEKVDSGKLRAEWGADENTLIIGLVGRIDPAKGQATFIRAAAGLSKDRKAGQKLKFVIIGEETLGETSTYLSELKEMVRDFRMEDQVFFAGFHENIPEVMAALDILVMPSRQEAFGLVAIEAMAMEVPIVISRGGSAREIVGEEEYGLLIRPEDAFDLQNQLRTLIRDPERRLNMGKQARLKVMSQYDRRHRIIQTLELYEWGTRRRERFSL